MGGTGLEPLAPRLISGRILDVFSSLLSSELPAVDFEPVLLVKP